MVEVFKTDISNNQEAEAVLNSIHASFEQYKANFDLQDCDNILRIETSETQVDSPSVIDLLKIMGFKAAVLEDKIPGEEYRSCVSERICHNLKSLFSAVG